MARRVGTDSMSIVCCLRLSYIYTKGHRGFHFLTFSFDDFHCGVVGRARACVHARLLHVVICLDFDYLFFFFLSSCTAFSNINEHEHEAPPDKYVFFDFPQLYHRRSLPDAHHTCLVSARPSVVHYLARRIVLFVYSLPSPLLCLIRMPSFDLISLAVSFHSCSVLFCMGSGANIPPPCHLPHSWSGFWRIKRARG